MSEDIVLDEWELKLEGKLKELQACQEEKGMNDCLTCEKTFDCEIRKEYVRAVYESMSKGAGGGFEF